SDERARSEHPDRLCAHFTPLSVLLALALLLHALALLQLLALLAFLGGRNRDRREGDAVADIAAVGQGVDALGVGLNGVGSGIDGGTGLIADAVAQLEGVRARESQNRVGASAARQDVRRAAADDVVGQLAADDIVELPQ